jgi:hypothetical protein
VICGKTICNISAVNKTFLFSTGGNLNNILELFGFVPINGLIEFSSGGVVPKKIYSPKSINLNTFLRIDFYCSQATSRILGNP